MARRMQVVTQESLRSAIGLLYQRKDAGAALMRVLEKYQSTGHRHASSCSRLTGPSHREEPEPGKTYQQKLQRLYLRRAVVDELIRCIEAYTNLTPSVTGRLAGPQANQ